MTAVFVEEGPDQGAIWHFGEPFKEEKALEAGTAWADLSHLKVISISGVDRLTWLHDVTTQHLSELSPGVWVDVMVLDPRGHVEHQFLLVDDGATSWAVVAPDYVEGLLGYLSKMIFTRQVEVRDASADYVVPIGKARIVQEANQKAIQNSESMGIITYGRGVYWSLEAAKEFEGQIEILDLRTINPLDMQAMESLCARHGKILLVTEESIENSFTLGIAGRLQQSCFQHLDAPISIVGSVDAPAIPLNSSLEAAMLPNAQKVAAAISKLLNY